MQGEQYKTRMNKDSKFAVISLKDLEIIYFHFYFLISRACSVFPLISGSFPQLQN